MNEMKKLSFSENVFSITAGENCQVYRTRDDSGEGVMTLYRVFEGVYLMYNDFHMQNCRAKVIANTELFCIDHCREGSLEHIAAKGGYSYIKAGDLRIDDRSNDYNTDCVLPLSHYHGITIAFFLDTAPKSLSDCFSGFPVDLKKLKHKYCRQKTSFVIRREPSVEHIFTELYDVPEKTRTYYFKIKIFELLLYLDALVIPEHTDIRPYFYKTQVEKVKAIHAHMTNNLEHHFTLEDLSKRFDISLTPMKTCFKGVYGTSVYAYMRSYRMSHAAVLLRTTKKSVAQIAGEVGYSSPSKFSVAFKDIIGSSPLEYRKSLV
ncbi:MAG: AraC family transcriptional regulator [Firmicutes bacterium]|nr:AraC family transcriptional regulator [Bacillota bacterium]